jgi:hypothetical protein
MELSAGSCVCKKGYSLKSGVCKKQTSVLIFALIPVILSLIIVPIVTVIVCKKRAAMKKAITPNLEGVTPAKEKFDDMASVRTNSKLAVPYFEGVTPSGKADV